MHRFIVRGAAVALLVSATAGVSAVQAEEQRGAILANTCFSCHGTDGRSAGAMPSIEGKAANYIADSLKHFRDGTKPGTVMPRIAKGFTDEEIAILADYFSSRR